MLNRLRTGECSDLEVLTGIALPPFSIGIVLLLAMSLTALVALGANRFRSTRCSS